MIEYVFVVRGHNGLNSSNKIFGIFQSRQDANDEIEKDQKEKGYYIRYTENSNYEQIARHYNGNAVYSIQMLPFNKFSLELERYE